MNYASDFIRIPTLDKYNVQVGDLYNYHGDNILKIPNLEVQREGKTTKETTCHFCHQKLEVFKIYWLGPDSRLRRSIEEKTAPDLSQYWFNNHLNTSQEEGNDRAQVYVFLRVVLKTEILSQDFLNSKTESGGAPTHFVDQVFYGIEFICSMKKGFDLSKERKEVVEDEMQSKAEEFFENILKPQTNTELPAELSKVNCQVYDSTSKVAETNKGLTFEEAIERIREIIFSTNQEDSLKAIEMNLREIPAQTKEKIYIDNVKCLQETNFKAIGLIRRQCKKLENPIGLHQIKVHTLTENLLSYFLLLLEPLENKIKSTYMDFITKLNSNQQLENQFSDFDGLLKEMKDWLKQLEQQDQKFFDLVMEFDMLTWEETKTCVQSSKEKTTYKIIALEIKLNEYNLRETNESTIGSREELSPSSMTELSNINKSLQDICNKLCEFQRKVKSSADQINPANNIELVDKAAETNESKVETIQEKNPSLCFDDMSSDSKEMEKNEKKDVADSDDDKMDIDKNEPTADCSGNRYEQCNRKGEDSKKHQQSATISPHQYSEFLNTGSTEKNKGDKQKGQKSHKEPKQNSNEIDEENLTGDKIINSDFCSTRNTLQLKGKHIEKGAISKNKVGQKAPNSCFDDDGLRGKTMMHRYDKKVQQVQRKEHLRNRRIAEVYEKDSNTYEIAQTGKPQVYLLNAEESSLSAELRWFNVVNSGIQSSLPHENHKVIILMGATGSGKSTLINGMVNYILGVQWKDPFRFKVVRDDESVTGKNQAHSQTSSVTAYTLEHQDGMAVPYSITIIDTPGYGDTRGIQRDKEITQTIHRFLSQPKAEINQIHAVCFVASSADTRLTHTQRYVLDSVMSTFGKDVKDNIRLLVTFADYSDPPVVEACKEAHFPITSKSSQILYNKFNSSVLYASNQEKEDDFSSDELYWDMGQESFENFFQMLEALDGCDLSSTKEVIQRRQQAQQALNDIEIQVNLCLAKIENIEQFKRKIREHGHNMEANKNFNIEITVFRPVLKIHKTRLRAAYNCHTCRKTCIPHEFLNTLRKVGNDYLDFEKPKCSSCTCSKLDHEFQYSEWSQRAENVTTTLHEMKSEYESNCKQQLSTKELLIKCTEDLEEAKAKVLSLLNQIEENSHVLDSTALLSTALSPVDYLSLMRSRVAEEQKPGYMIRLETLSELQRSLTTQTSCPLGVSPVSEPLQEETPKHYRFSFQTKSTHKSIPYNSRTFY